MGSDLLHGKIIYTLFQERTRVYYFNLGLTLGSARYIATGRSLTSMSSNFVDLYTKFARSVDPKHSRTRANAPHPPFVHGSHPARLPLPAVAALF